MYCSRFCFHLPFLFLHSLVSTFLSVSHSLALQLSSLQIHPLSHSLLYILPFFTLPFSSLPFSTLLISTHPFIPLPFSLIPFSTFPFTHSHSLLSHSPLIHSPFSHFPLSHSTIFHHPISNFLISHLQSPILLPSILHFSHRTLWTWWMRCSRSMMILIR